jgi:hypothetical protein
LMHMKRRRTTRSKNEHRVEIDVACHAVRTKSAHQQPAAGVRVLTRHERANKLYNHRTNEPDQKGARAALATCTDTSHTVSRIIGWRLETNHKNRNCLKRKKSEGCSQAQYLVDWAPTLEEAWAVQAYKELGYRVVNVSP